MRIALAQYALGSEMKDNLGKALRSMEEAARERVQLVCFPELCLSPFFPQLPGQDVSQYAIPIQHDHIKQFQSTCKQLKLAATPNVYLEEKNRRFDASLLIGDSGSIVGISKMVHIAQLPCFYEQDYYTPSDTGFSVYEMSLGKIGIVVCFDRHFPESIRTCVLRGAQLIVIPTANTTAEPGDMFEWELRVAAMQNGVYIAMCNRVGPEGAVTFCGESIIVDPHGEVVTKASDAEGIVIADIDMSEVDHARDKRPYISLRRPPLYEK
jgi:N-carbamoylputrescine amidase